MKSLSPAWAEGLGAAASVGASVADLAGRAGPAAEQGTPSAGAADLVAQEAGPAEVAVDLEVVAEAVEVERAAGRAIARR